MAIKRACIVGLGSIGRRHLRLLAARGDLALECVELRPDVVRSSADGDKFERVFASFETMLESIPDLVVIATPHACHAIQTIEALRAGAHVFCEKPMSSNLSEAIEIARAAKAAAGLYNTGFQLHFHPALVALKALIRAGDLGHIVHIHCRVGTYTTLERSVSRYQSEQEGARLFDYCHQPDLLYWLTGQIPRFVYASAIQAGELELTSNPNVAALSFEYAGSLLTDIHLNYLQAPERHEYEVVGDRGWARLDMTRGILDIGLRATNMIESRIYPVERDDLYRAEWDAFFLAVNQARPSESPANQAIVSVLMCEGAIASWKNKNRFCYDPLIRSIQTASAEQA
jgi:predicted dehydrogenase